MYIEMSNAMKARFTKLGFKRDNPHYWSASLVLNENESLVVDQFGFVYAHSGWRKSGDQYMPICVNIVKADTPAKVEVLIKPMVENKTVEEKP